MLPITQEYLACVIHKLFPSIQFEDGALDKFREVIEKWFNHFIGNSKKIKQDLNGNITILEDFNQGLNLDTPRRKKIVSGSFFKDKIGELFPAVEESVKAWYCKTFSCNVENRENQAQEFIQRFLISYVYEIVNETVQKIGQNVTWEELRTVYEGFGEQKGELDWFRDVLNSFKANFIAIDALNQWTEVGTPKSAVQKQVAEDPWQFILDTLGIRYGLSKDQLTALNGEIETAFKKYEKVDDLYSPAKWDKIQQVIPELYGNLFWEKVEERIKALKERIEKNYVELFLRNKEFRSWSEGCSLCDNTPGWHQESRLPEELLAFVQKYNEKFPDKLSVDITAEEILHFYLRIGLLDKTLYSTTTPHHYVSYRLPYPLEINYETGMAKILENLNPTVQVKTTPNTGKFFTSTKENKKATLTLEKIDEDEALITCRLIKEGNYITPTKKRKLDHKRLKDKMEELEELSNALNELRGQESYQAQMKLARKEIEDIGEELFDQLPDDAQETFKNPDVVISLGLDSKLINIPWEFLHNENGFLCLKHPMARQYISEKNDKCCIRSWEKRNVEKFLIVIDPSLPGAKAERESIINALKPHPGIKPIILEGANATKEKFIDHLRKGCDFVHFAGHATFNPENASNSGISLNGEIIRADSIQPHIKKHPPILVFINACEAGKQDSSQGVKRYENQVTGFAESFLVNGSNFIGPLLPVWDDAAHRFAENVYAKLFTLNFSLGEAIMASRQEILNEFKEEEIAWASYVFYGDPNLRLQFEN